MRHFSTARGSFLFDEKRPLGRFSTGVIIRRYTGEEAKHSLEDERSRLIISVGL